MLFERDNPKGTPNDLRQEPESPFLNEELFADAEAEMIEERASRLIGYQLESPFQYVFKQEDEAFDEGEEVDRYSDKLDEKELEELEEQECDEEMDDEGLVTELQVANPSAPRPLGSETTPPDQTLYVKIDLGIGKIAVELCKKYEKTDGSKKKCIEYHEEFVQVQPKTGIFIPENYSPQPAVDLILYLHGHTIDYPGLNVSIDGYWGNPKFPFFALRQEVNASKKNVILIAPTLGPKSEAGPWLTSKYGLDRYLDQVLEALKARGPYKGQSPTIGNIILAGHSGGGSPMQKLALSTNRYTAKIKECWGFDSLYGGVKEGKNWIKWAGLNQVTDTKTGKKLFIYYYNTKMKSENLKKLSYDEKLLDVTVFISKFVSKSSFKERYKVDHRDEVDDHFKVPITYFRERLQDTSFLNKITSYEQPISSLFSALGSLVKRFQELIASGQERLAIALAYQQGVTDESKLTNLVFFARHPELGGRRIRSDEKALATEWLDIRNQVVRPALPPGQAREMFLAEPDEEAFARETAEAAELIEFLVETDEREEGKTDRFLAEAKEEEFDTEAEAAFVEYDVVEAGESGEELYEEEFDNSYEASSSGVVTFPSGESLTVVSGPEGKGETYYDPNHSGNPLLDTGGVNRLKHLSKDFTVDEFARSGEKRFDLARIDPKLIECLQKLRDHLGKAVEITSGYRSYEHNEYLWRQCEERKKKGEKCTVAKESQHLRGQAADIQVTGMNGLDLAKAAIDACGCDVSIGVASTYIHVDVGREPRFWGYGKSRENYTKAIEDYHQERCAEQPVRPPLDVKEAVRLNRYYSKQLGWDFDQIQRFLGLDATADEQRLAIAVARWQEGQPGLKVDGIVGPITWRQMQKALGTAGAAPTTPTAVTPSTPTMGADEVRRFLTLLGYDLSLKGGTDALERALRDFQQDVGIPRSGRLDIKTEAALRSLLDQLQQASNRPPSLQRMSRFRRTSYYVPVESSIHDNPVIPVLDQNGQVIAKVDPAFFLSMSVEGTGRLRNGDLLNVVGSEEKGGIQDVTRYPEYQQLLGVARKLYKPERIDRTGVRLKDGRIVSVLAFHKVAESKKGKGYGIRGLDISYEPFKTLAADIGHYRSSDQRFRKKGGLVPLGTRVFILELAGVRLPDGTIHDGWCTVNDTGGAIYGAHFDVFTGSRAWSKQANLPDIVHVWFNQSEERCPPDYVYGLFPKK